MLLRLLECFEEANECLAVWRQGMLYKLAAIFVVYKPGLIKPPRMLANSFFVCFECLNNILQSYAVALGDKKKYLYAMVI